MPMSMDNKFMMQKNFVKPLLSLRNELLFTICVRIPCMVLWTIQRFLSRTVPSKNSEFWCHILIPATLKYHPHYNFKNLKRPKRPIFKISMIEFHSFLVSNTEVSHTHPRGRMFGRRNLYRTMHNSLRAEM